MLLYSFDDFLHLRCIQSCRNLYMEVCTYMYVCRMFTRSSGNGETRRLHRGDSMCQVRLHMAKLIVSPGSYHTHVDPKSCWPLSTKFKNSENNVGGQNWHLHLLLSLSLITTKWFTEAAEFARKSTVQNYCPHTSFPTSEYESIDKVTNVYHSDVAPQLFAPGILREYFYDWNPIKYYICLHWLTQDTVLFWIFWYW